MDKEALKKAIKAYVREKREKGFIEILDILVDEAFFIADYFLAQREDEKRFLFWDKILVKIDDVSRKIKKNTKGKIPAEFRHYGKKHLKD